MLDILIKDVINVNIQQVARVTSSFLQVDMLNLLSHTSDTGWFCSVRNSALSLTLTKSLYTECGLQCKKTRDVTKTRDLFVFSCDLSELSAHNRTKLTYCFTNVLKHDYMWYFSDATPASQVSKSTVQVPVSIDTTEDLQEVVDSVGAQLLRITPGSHDSAVNTLTWDQHHSSVPCWSYHSDCCATGTGICHVIRDYKDNVRFLNLVLLRTTSESSKHVTCYFSGSDDVYLLQYDVR